MNPEDFSAAPALVRKTAEAGSRSPGTALNFVGQLATRKNRERGI